MSFTYDPSAPFDALATIRLLTFDTDSADALLQDEEIAVLMALESGDPSAAVNVHRVAAEAARTIAGNFGRVGEQADDRVRVQFDQRAADYRVLEAELRDRADRGAAPVMGGSSISTKQAVDDNEDRVRPAFTRDVLTPVGTATGAPPSVFANWPPQVFP